MALTVNTNLQGDIIGIRDTDVASEALTVNTNFQDVVTGIRDADFATERLIDNMMTGVRDVDSTAGPGGSTFRSGEDDNIVVIHPTFRSVDDVDGVSDQCPQLRGEVEWTYIGDNLSGTPGPGGSTFTTGYAEAVGLDYSTLELVDQISNTERGY